MISSGALFILMKRIQFSKGIFPDNQYYQAFVCLKMLKEVIEEAYASSFQLETASSVKFLTMFAPPQFTSAVFEIKPIVYAGNQLTINATLKFEQHVFLKFNGIYKRVSS